MIHTAHHRSGMARIDKKLHVVTMISNPVRWRTRYENYHRFEEHVSHSGAELWTCEVAFGDRPFEVTSPDNPHHLQLRTSTELWHKENALNLMIERLPADAEYIAWIDADVKFARNDWVQETIHQLQHYDFVQMFSHAQDLTDEFKPGTSVTGFVYNYQNHPETFARRPKSYYGYGRGPNWHPGYAWAAKRSALDKVGTLIDWAILGSADWIMACALIGKVEAAMEASYSQSYKRMGQIWQARAEKNIHRNIGYVPGLLYHLYHGDKKHRGYCTRHEILVRTKFDPVRDLKRDVQGLWQIEPDAMDLRDALRAYNRSRNEDR